jgi:hypothetical protein
MHRRTSRSGTRSRHVPAANQRASWRPCTAGSARPGRCCSAGSTRRRLPQKNTPITTGNSASTSDPRATPSAARTAEPRAAPPVYRAMVVAVSATDEPSAPTGARPTAVAATDPTTPRIAPTMPAATAVAINTLSSSRGGEVGGCRGLVPKLPIGDDVPGISEIRRANPQMDYVGEAGCGVEVSGLAVAGEADLEQGVQGGQATDCGQQRVDETSGAYLAQFDADEADHRTAPCDRSCR